jgi:undecaprenyl diphosphate synthase
MEENNPESDVSKSVSVPEHVFELTLKETHPDLYQYTEERIAIEKEKWNKALETKPDAALSEHIKTLPKIHIGIIPDGNRRWCKKNNKNRFEYAAMIKHMIMKIYNDYRHKTEEEEIPYETFRMVNEVSIYVLSKDNLLKRNDETMVLIEKTMELICDLMQIESNNKHIKFDVLGDISLLPPVIQQQINTCISLSRGTFPIHLAIGYDPIEDSALYLKEGIESRRQIDLVIRSGAQLRSSGFFPLQTLYSEWVYFDDLWPDMSQDKFHEALLQFIGRQRNFGK